MNIEELRVRKARLELDMADAVARLVNDFYEETGVSPSEIQFLATKGESFGVPKNISWDVRFWCDISI